MLIITSAQYVDSELTAELGELPPTFLPVGNKRLFHHQIAQFREHKNIILTLPLGFVPPQQDLDWLHDNHITLCFIAPELSLKASLTECLELNPPDDEQLLILHGDTLIFDIDTMVRDQISVASTDEYYRWAGLTFSAGGTIITERFDARSPGLVVSGFFSFAHPRLLQQSLTHAETFVDALNRYSSTQQLAVRHYPQWLDFGHLHTYFRSKSRITTQRAFNDLSISPRVVSKRSENAAKMRAEHQWFLNIPQELRLYTPQILGYYQDQNSAGYDMEYLYMSALNELAVFGTLPGVVWKKIISSCYEFIHAMRGYSGPSCMADSVNCFYRDKTFQRLDELRDSGIIDITSPNILNGLKLPSIEQIAHASLNAIPPAKAGDIVISHGDFCFSNILYDFRVQSVRVIDPRGTLNDRDCSVYGDTRYDVAKLCHSLIGQYDYIISERYRLKNTGNIYDFDIETDDALSSIGENFFSETETRYSEEEIIPIVLNLFITMLPLHADSALRQKALTANALRLYAQYREIFQ